MTVEWIFFDCFNTLIDDFDLAGDISGLGPMQHLPVRAGLYDSADEFCTDYLDWRSQQWVEQWREVSLYDRMRAVLRRRSPQITTAQLEQLVGNMVTCYTAHYPHLLRLPDGVTTMLRELKGKVKMGVVSNFHLPQWPVQSLKRFGLHSYFDFVLDSAACGWRKPGPQIYQIARRFATVPEAQVNRILFVGDHLHNDVLMPRSLGMRGIYFDRSAERPSSRSAPSHVTSITHWQQFPAILEELALAPPASPQ